MALQRLVMTVLLVGLLLAAGTLLRGQRLENACADSQRHAQEAVSLFGGGRGPVRVEGCP